ncbi:MAG: TonB-dependent receptor [Gemmatimonadetes bacterium]|nr:TonB-dependent receptor [Gemmatimonadota bacterium]
MTPGRAARLRRACALALLACAAPAAARADAAGCPDPPSVQSPGAWAPPLDRPLAFAARDLSLRDALDRVAAATRLRISYSAQLLPLERRVCVSRQARTVGDVLAELLRDTQVEPVVAGADHVVLALRRGGATAPEPRAEFSRVVPLEGVVVTGSAAGGPERALPYALDVVAAEEAAREGPAPLAGLLAAASGGWIQPAGSLAGYGGLRGASSFGAGAPRVFIDGIEVANPLLVTQIAPEAVERIEVIRGPQGAALYGTGAMTGIVNIVTRHEGTDGGAPPLRVRGSFGRAESGFAPGGALAQEVAVALRTGSRVRSAGMDVGIGGIGEFLPDGASRYLLAGGSARQVGARSITTAIVRFYDARAGAAVNPLLAEAMGARADSVPAAAPGEQRMRQYTVGTTIRMAPDERWTHTLTAGIDGDRLSGVPDPRTAVPAGAEGAWPGTAGGADRGTVRLSSVGRLGVVGGTGLTLTLAGELSALREQVDAPAAGMPLVSWTQSSGVVAQAAAVVRERLHLTGGLRVERHDGLAGSRYAALPVLGGVWVTEAAGGSLRVRAAYGGGVGPARAPGAEHPWGGSRSGRGGRDLAPERQSGVEAGVDLAIGSVLSLQVTAYEQLASGPLQRVGRAADSLGPQTAYAFGTVGQISNRGWEMQGSARLGRLSLQGAAFGVESRVRSVAGGYGGDLRAGDRMLDVPALTLSGTAAWTARGWSAALTGYRAFDWIGYDRLALARDFQGTRAGSDASGAGLRGYWRRYDGVPRLNATATLDLPGGTVLVLTGDNLLHRQQADRLTVVPGRILMVGVRAAF